MARCISVSIDGLRCGVRFSPKIFIMPTSFHFILPLSVAEGVIRIIFSEMRRLIVPPEVVVRACLYRRLMNLATSLRSALYLSLISMKRLTDKVYYTIENIAGPVRKLVYAFMIGNTT